MSKKTIRTRTIKDEVEEKQSNAVYKLIKKFFTDGEFNEELNNFSYVIKVWKFSDDNVPIRVTNAKFDNLAELYDRLGAMFGSSRFRIIVEAYDSEGKFNTMYKAEDIRTEYAGQENGQGEEVDVQEDYRLQIELKKMEYDQQLKLEQMRQQTETIKAIAAAKGGGNNWGQMFSIFQKGMKLGQGGTISDDDDRGEGEENGALGLIKELITIPGAKEIIGALIAPKPTALPPQSIESPPQKQTYIHAG